MTQLIDICGGSGRSLVHGLRIHGFRVSLPAGFKGEFAIGESPGERRGFARHKGNIRSDARI